VATQKKSPIAQERDEEARALWRWLVSRFDVRRLVFVDESGTHISMDRLRSRAPRGERAYGQVPKNRGNNLTLIASPSLHGMGESMVVEGATDAKAFEVYVEHFLAPSLREGQVVVMDNLGAHQPKRIRELIEASGAELVFAPSYSPDLNPIEQAFSKIRISSGSSERAPMKPYWRRWRRRSPRSLLLMPLDGSITAATRSKSSTYEYRCKSSWSDSLQCS
jgi:transposase